ncbi:hypothetical protein GCM10007877_19600 [Marinibactrum halimedae]|uniref:HD domain-containing protein n=1 Tax=Marinibactrum halimedae TaxID=1444977 RepID=A0AA37TA69_9GAMM|nr:AAA family ATPase [Marinibactrum halimedae]GLS26245.1 hypothetical protein GCM10007877_19600 [Marinibactrum halimedae]
MNDKTLSHWLESLSLAATPDIDECIDTLGDHISWLYEFKDTQQDPEWHAEGDVHIHTGMVLNELYDLLGSQARHITGGRRQALILAALLHDIGKPKCTKAIEIKGIHRIASPQHESIGRSYLAFALQTLPLSFEVYWQVLGLVGEHHMPKLLAVKNMSRGQYLALSRRTDTELLYWLEVADMRGRKCPDLSLQLSHLDEFALFAEEYNVWGKAFMWPQSALIGESDTARHYVYASGLQAMEQDRIFHPDEALAIAYQHKDQHPQVMVMCGPSGSGKSTWIAQHASEYEVISLDELRQEVNGNRSNQKTKDKFYTWLRIVLKTVCAEKRK